MARKSSAKSMTEDEMFSMLPEKCKNDVVKEICGMFIESRMELGFPFTDRAFKIVINKYEWTDEMLAASLLCAMERGWRGVFLPEGKMYREYADAYHRMLDKAVQASVNDRKDENKVEYISRNEKIENGKHFVFEYGFWHPKWKTNPANIFLPPQWMMMTNEQKVEAMRQYEY